MNLFGYKTINTLWNYFYIGIWIHFNVIVMHSCLKNKWPFTLLMGRTVLCIDKINGRLGVSLRICLWTWVSHLWNRLWIVLQLEWFDCKNVKRYFSVLRQSRNHWFVDILHFILISRNIVLHVANGKMPIDTRSYDTGNIIINERILLPLKLWVGN